MHRLGVLTARIVLFEEFGRLIDGVRKGMAFGVRLVGGAGDHALKNGAVLGRLLVAAH